METLTVAQYKAHRSVGTPLDGNAVASGALWLSFPPPSLNNLYINQGKAHGRFKSVLYRTWQARAFAQLRKQGSWHVPGAISIKLLFSRKETKADLDNMIKPTLDLLMAAGRISDDRNVMEIHAAFGAEATGTRIEIRAQAAT